MYIWIDRPMNDRHVDILLRGMSADDLGELREALSNEL